MYFVIAGCLLFVSTTLLALFWEELGIKDTDDAGALSVFVLIACALWPGLIVGLTLWGYVYLLRKLKAHVCRKYTITFTKKETDA